MKNQQDEWFRTFKFDEFNSPYPTVFGVYSIIQ